jgi:hypothetical protein
LAYTFYTTNSGEPLEIVEKTFTNKGGLEGQRDTLKTTTAIRIRKRMGQDLEAGTVLPPIVIGAILTGSDFDELDKIRDSTVGWALPTDHT